MSDEIYEKLVYDPEFRHKSIASVSPEMNELTITINGFSKAYSMPGWRLGYLAAPKWLADRIIAFQSHTTSNPTSFAQYGALAALTGTQEPVEQMRQAFAKRRDLIYSLISAIPGIKTIRPSGAFYLFFDVSSFGLNSTDFVNRLLEEEKVAGVPARHSATITVSVSPMPVPRRPSGKPPRESQDSAKSFPDNLQDYLPSGGDHSPDGIR